MKRKMKLSYLLTIFIIFTITFLIPLTPRAQVIEEWVRRYNGMGNGGDQANAMAIDRLGNIYVTGYSNDYTSAGSDYITIKYAPDGTQLWVKGYNGTGNGDDKANAIAIDRGGYIYVTGYSTGSETGVDYATVKYDSSGRQLWVKRHNGTGNGTDYANAIAVDLWGCIYVTGNSTSSGTCVDYATVKYNSSGSQLWVKRYNGTGNGDDNANAIAIDRWGYIYVTGQSTGNGTYLDYATVKYDSYGRQLWIKRYNGTGNSLDIPRAVAVDRSGNIYVTGESVGNGTYLDYATVKYDFYGRQLWIRRYTGVENGSDQARAIAIDESGNIYVTGQSYADYATVKYDSYGRQLWVKRYNGTNNNFDYAGAIAIDESGNVYVAGGSFGIWTYLDCLTIKYRQ